MPRPQPASTGKTFHGFSSSSSFRHDSDLAAAAKTICLRGLSSAFVSSELADMKTPAPTWVTWNQSSVKLLDQPSAANIAPWILGSSRKQAFSETTCHTESYMWTLPARPRTRSRTTKKWRVSADAWNRSGSLPKTLVTSNLHEHSTWIAVYV